jgi:exodeoxyribonuclease VII small subunit
MPDESEATFEQALSQLEHIVEELERGEPALSAALAHYEQGVKLLRHCYHLLDQAEQSVALLTGVDPEGNPLTTPFDATATAAWDVPLSEAPAGFDPILPPRARDPRSRNLPTDPSDRVDPPF